MYYVYELCDDAGKTFYVGKGKAGRWNHHEKLARQGFTYRVHNKIRKLWSEGRKIQKRIVFETSNEEVALAKEMEVIARYGLENLTNMTSGGDSVRFTPELKQRISNALKGKPKTEEAKRKYREAKIGKPTWNKGKHHTLETRQKMSRNRLEKYKGRVAWNKGLPGHPAWNKGIPIAIKTRDLISSKLKGIPHSAEHKARIRLAACFRWLLDKVQQTGYSGA